MSDTTTGWDPADGSVFVPCRDCYEAVQVWPPRATGRVPWEVHCHPVDGHKCEWKWPTPAALRGSDDGG